MGWDAYATRDGKEILHEAFGAVTKFGDPWRLPAGPERDAFEAASARIKAADLTHDGLLSIGGLDCTVCAYAIGRATGIDAWGKDLTPAAVKALKPVWPTAAAVAASVRHSAAGDRKLKFNGEVQIDGIPLWAWVSAREFLETCAKLGLGVHWSW